ncbi:hypothetical protein JOD57_004925 [Geodermatophilus bullaregiensis]|uniref:hypothetical protein n=1 Tax=Geodermatophilus bullaregiensis TaxID=1564160 RepID=UPI00195867B5|nr:hypothetical protein [Geodermatophilus bullaregiensis]MBM7809088.1 hypothetical protein [Geodermatophilus bullaregiensis]
MTQFEPPRITASEDLAMPPPGQVPPVWESPAGDALDELTVRVARDLRDKEWVRGVYRRLDTPTKDAIVIWVDHIGRRDELPREIAGHRVIVEPHDPIEILPA